MVVEAAATACDLAPGLARDRWGFFGWAGFDEEVWADLLDEADERFERGLAAAAGAGASEAPASTRPDLDVVRFAGLCTSSPAIARARGRAKRAGLRQAVSIEQGGAEEAAGLVERVASAAAHAASGVEEGSGERALPGGERAGGARALVGGERAGRCRRVRRRGRRRSGGLGVRRGGRRGRGGPLRRPPCIREELGRERVAVEALVFDEPPAMADVVMVPDPAGGAEHRVEVLEPASEQFASRLFKVAKERRKWARREGVSCYRVYDADLPDYAVAIDVYAGAGEAEGNAYLHVAEYAPPSSIDPAKARRRFDDVLALAPVVLGIRPDHVFAKTRRRDKGGAQYRDAGRRSYVTQVRRTATCWRWTCRATWTRACSWTTASRASWWARRRPASASSTCSPTRARRPCTRPAGGGRDDHGRPLADLPGLGAAQHGGQRLRRAGALPSSAPTPWSGSPRRAASPCATTWCSWTRPRSPNSKAMGSRTWDVQRDHVELLIGVSRLLTEGGEAVFSCNLRSFKPDVEALAKYGVAIEDVTAQTIPHDFERNPRIHKCYLVKRTQ